jgi:hypothetical protein
MTKKNVGHKKAIWDVTDERMQKLRTQIIDYTTRKRKKEDEQKEVTKNLHTAMALIEKLHGGKHETVLQIDGKTIVLTIDKNLVDWDAVDNIKKMSIYAAEKRGLALMRKALRLYRRTLNLQKSIARSKYLAAKHSREYAERRTGTRTAPRKVARLAILKNTMLDTRSKYQNFEKNKATATVERANYKVDTNKIHVGYLGDYLTFDNYQEYADYDRAWHEERGLTNYRQKRKYTRKPKALKADIPKADETQQIQQIDVQPMPKRKRGRPLGSKNKPKTSNIAVTA